MHFIIINTSDLTIVCMHIASGVAHMPLPIRIPDTLAYGFEKAIDPTTAIALGPSKYAAVQQGLLSRCENLSFHQRFRS